MLFALESSEVFSSVCAPTVRPLSVVVSPEKADFRVTTKIEFPEVSAQACAGKIVVMVGVDAIATKKTADLHIEAVSGSGSRREHEASECRTAIGVVSSLFVSPKMLFQ